MCRHGIRHPNADTERIKSGSGCNGECTDGLRSVALKRDGLWRVGNGQQDRHNGERRIDISEVEI